MILVSIIISTYNSEKFFVGRIDDLIAQSIFSESEILVVDSGSKQNEAKLIQPYLLKYKNIKYIRTEQRETIYMAWNRAIKLATGKYITNANTDDRLRNDALEVMVSYLEKYTDVDIVYADQFVTSIENSNYDISKRMKSTCRPKFRTIKLLERCIMGSQPMWRSKIHTHQNIWYDQTLEIAGDYDFECNALLKSKALLIPEVLGVYYLGRKNENKEFQKIESTFDETFQIMFKYNSLYINQLSAIQRKKMMKNLKYQTFLGKYLYSGFRKIFNLFFPRFELMQRSYIYFLLALNEYLNHNLIKAKIYCLDYLKKSNSPIILRLLKEINLKLTNMESEKNCI